MALLRDYRIPLLVAILAVVGLAWWAGEERQNFEEIKRKGQRQIVSGLFDILAGILYEASGETALRRTHLRSVLERLIATSPLQYIILYRGERIDLRTPNAPLVPRPAQPQGESFEAGHFLFWRQLAALDPGAQVDNGPEQPGQAHQDNRDWLLIIGGEFSRRGDEETVALERLYFTQFVVFLAVAAGFAVWIATLRGRLLSEQLRVERLRSAHLEDLELSAAGLAHETKNPLGIISGLTQQIAQEEAIPDASRLKLEQILDEVDRTTARLGHFLTYARVRKSNAKPLAARNVLGAVTAVLSSEFEVAGVGLVVACEPLCILADEEMLRQILVNLLLNGLQASAAGGTVTVGTRRRGRDAELFVEDKGTGIDPELMPRVFKPYVTTRAGGHGLGLAIVKRYVDEHGWTIGTESAPDRGTLVIISGIRVAPFKPVQC